MRAVVWLRWRRHTTKWLDDGTINCNNPRPVLAHTHVRGTPVCVRSAADTPN
jgi:hypothetical protein